MTTRVEIFNEIVGHLFAHMHETFPFPAEFDIEELAKKLEAEPGTFMNSDELDWSRAKLETGDEIDQFVEETLKWLDREGFVERVRAVQFCARLTAKAFAALNTMPAGLSATATLGQSLASAAKEGGKEVSKAALGDLAQMAISAGVTMMVRSITP